MRVMILKLSEEKIEWILLSNDFITKTKVMEMKGGIARLDFIVFKILCFKNIIKN